jgi:hypothetical protein
MQPDRLSNRGWTYIGGADYAHAHDNAAVLVLAANSSLGKIRVAAAQRFAPKKNAEIDIETIHETVMRMHSIYKPISWHWDSRETIGQSQKMRRLGIRVVIESMAGQATANMAFALLSAVNSGQLEIHPSLGSLIQDLREMSLVTKNNVLRVVADRSKRGHADEGFAMLCCLVTARELAGRYADFASGITTMRVNRDCRRLGVQLFGNSRTGGLGYKLFN